MNITGTLRIQNAARIEILAIRKRRNILGIPTLAVKVRTTTEGEPPSEEWLWVNDAINLTVNLELEH